MELFCEPGSDVEILRRLYSLTQTKWDNSLCKLIAEKKNSQAPIGIKTCKHFISETFSPWLVDIILPLVSREKLADADFSYFESTSTAVSALFYFFALIRLHHTLPSVNCLYNVNSNLLEQLRGHPGYPQTPTSAPETRPGAPCRAETWAKLRMMFERRRDDDEDRMFCDGCESAGLAGSSVVRSRQLPVSAIPQYIGGGAKILGILFPGINPPALKLAEIRQLVFSPECRKPMLDIMAECFPPTKTDFTQRFRILRELVDELDSTNLRKTGRLHTFGYSLLFCTPQLPELFRIAHEIFSKSEESGAAAFFAVDGTTVDKWKNLSSPRYPEIDLFSDPRVLSEFVRHIVNRRIAVDGMTNFLSVDYSHMVKMERSEDSIAQVEEIQKSSIPSKDESGAVVGGKIPTVIAEEISPGTEILSGGQPKLRYNLFMLLCNVLARCAMFMEPYARMIANAFETHATTIQKLKETFDQLPADTGESKKKINAREAWLNASLLYLQDINVFPQAKDGEKGKPYPPLPSRQPLSLFNDRKTPDVFQGVAENVLRSCCTPEVASHFITTVTTLHTPSFRTGIPIVWFDLREPKCRVAFQQILTKSWRLRDAVNHNRDNKHPITAKMLELETETLAKGVSMMQKDSVGGFGFEMLSRMPTGFTKSLKQKALQGIWKTYGSGREIMKSAARGRNTNSRSRTEVKESGSMVGDGDDESGDTRDTNETGKIAFSPGDGSN